MCHLSQIHLLENVDFAVFLGQTIIVLRFVDLVDYIPAVLSYVSGTL